MAAKRDFETTLSQIASVPADQRTFANTIEAFETAKALFADQLQPLTFLNRVSPNPKVRSTAQKMEEASDRYSIAVWNRPDLYQAVKSYADKKESLAPADARLLDQILLTFKRNGHGLSAQDKARLQEKQQRLASLESQFKANVNADNGGLDLTREQLRGLPDEFVHGLARAADGKYHVTLKTPDYAPFMQYAQDAEARRALQLLYNTRAADKNLPILTETLRLRHESAQLLGYKSHPDLALDSRMAQTPQRVWDFLNRLVPLLREKGEKELAELLQLKRQDVPTAQRLESWDPYHYQEKLRKTKYSLDDEKVKEYFPVDRVVEGTMRVYERILGVKFTEVANADRWNPDVKLFRVNDAQSGEELGYFYLDLYPREGKYSHAAVMSIISGRTLPGGSYLKPVSAMVANLAKPTPGKPTLLPHDEVETFFHEFGHLMHHTLSKTRYASASAFNVARDFVEAPSQMLENFVWEREILNEISGHYKDGSPLPEELFQKMLAARRVHLGALFYLRQVAYGMIDLVLHTAVPQETSIIFNQIMETIALIPVQPGARSEAAFDHLMNGYDAGYYSYLWSEVFAKDIFTRFKKEGLFNPAVGMAWRREVLEHGADRPEPESLKAFLGRAPDEQAFMAEIQGKQTTPAPNTRRYLLDRVGDLGFLQLYADGFEQLPLDQKILAYHLSQAAWSGKDIVFDQTHRHAVEIKELLEQVLTHSQGLDSSLRAKIHEYFLRFFANHGQYSHQTNEKFVPSFSVEDLRSAMRVAQNNGAFSGNTPEKLDAKLKTLQASIFDPSFEPFLANTSSKGDLLAGSAVNFYSGVTQAQAEAQDKGKPYPVVDRLVQEGGAIREEIYRAGDPARGIPPGKYAEELGQVIGHLEQALPYAFSPRQKEALQHLIAFFQSGDPADFREYNRAWMHDNSPVDAILGFIETYLDPLGRRGAFEGIISFRDQEFTKVVEIVAGQSAYFEETAPWDAKYKKDKVVPIIANAVKVLHEVGDATAGLLLGVNLPNDESLRETEGSKNIIISNAQASWDGYVGSKLIEEFGWDQHQLELDKKWSGEAENLMVALHEVVGHASGKVSDKLAGQPAVYIKEYFSALEEARAELFALWAIADPKLQSLGVVKSPEIIEQAYRDYATKGGLTQLKKAPAGDKLTQAHARARNIIVTYLLKKTRAVEERRRDGKIYLYVTDLEKMHEGVGELLGKLMTIKAEGDYAGAKELFDTYGDPINQEWRADVVSRYQKLQLPASYTPISPQLTPVRDSSGKIVDVQVLYPESAETALLAK